MNLSKILKITSVSVVFVILFLYFFHPVANLTTDLGLYLKTGEIILQTKAIPSTNLFSYTYPSFHFINPNWLSEVFFYLIYKYLSFNGLIILSLLLIISAFGLIFVTASKYKPKFLVIVTVSLIYVQILFGRTDIKPELFSFLFLSVFLAILYKYREKYTKWIYALIPLELLWVNLHIYFFIGILVLLVFSLDAFLLKNRKRLSKKNIRLYLVTAASGIATLGNPNFIKGVLYPLSVLNNYGFKVQENINFFTAIKTPSFEDPTFLYFGLAVAILWISLLLSLKKVATVGILLSIIFTFAGFYAVRAFPLFVFGTYIACIKSTSNVIDAMSKAFNKRKLSVAGIALSIFVIILTFSSVKSNINNRGVGFGFGVIDNANDAVNFFLKNNIKGPIYNNYDIGSYLDFILYPKEKVFIDARPEAYPNEFFTDVYIPMHDSLTKFNQVADIYKFNSIIWDHTNTTEQENTLLSQMVRSDEWKLVYLNSMILISIKNTPENKSLISKYLITENTVKLSKEDLNSKKNLEKLSNLFKNLGWYNLMLEVNLRYLDFEPNNCGTLKNVLYLMQKQNNPQSTIYMNKYLQYCN